MEGKMRAPWLPVLLAAALALAPGWAYADDDAAAQAGGDAGIDVDAPDGVALRAAPIDADAPADADAGIASEPMLLLTQAHMPEPSYADDWGALFGGDDIYVDRTKMDNEHVAVWINDAAARSGIEYLDVGDERCLRLNGGELKPMPTIAYTGDNTGALRLGLPSAGGVDMQGKPVFRVVYQGAGYQVSSGRQLDVVLECYSVLMDGDSYWNTERDQPGANNTAAIRSPQGNGLSLFITNSHAVQSEDMRYVYDEDTGQWKQYPHRQRSRVEMQMRAYAVFADDGMRAGLMRGEAPDERAQGNLTLSFVDIDQPDFSVAPFAEDGEGREYGARRYAQDFAESVQLDGDVEAVYLRQTNAGIEGTGAGRSDATRTMIAVGDIQALGRIRGTGQDNDSQMSGAVVRSIDDGKLDFTWRGVGCGTILDLGMTSSLRGSGTAQLHASKQMHGRPLVDGEFSFELIDRVTGEVLQTARNDAEGGVSFAVDYDENDVTTHLYAIREQVPTQADELGRVEVTDESGVVRELLAYDTHQEDVDVKVEFAPGTTAERELICTPVYASESGAVFANRSSDPLRLPATGGDGIGLSAAGGSVLVIVAVLAAAFKKLRWRQEEKGR